MFQFWFSCAACNDILVIPVNGQTEYHGSSTDEITLVEAANSEGISLVYREGDEIRIQVQQSQQLKFRVRHKIEFSSERKRMTAVLESLDHDEDFVYIYSKGADSVILASCTTEKSLAQKASVDQHLDDFSKEGYRTLAFSVKVWKKQQFDVWNRKMEKATAL